MTSPTETLPSLTSSSLWDSDFFRFEAAEVEVATQLRDWLSLSKTKLGRYLAELKDGSNFGEFESREVLALEKAIQKSAPKEQDFVVALRMIAKIINRLNREGKARIAPAQLHRLIKVEKNKSCSRVVPAQRLLMEWREARRQWMASLVAPKKDRINVPSALAILSGTLDGEILDSDLAIALEDACLSEKKMFALARVRADGGSAVCQGIYIDVRLSWQGMPEEEDRRWYGSLLQASLFARVDKQTIRPLPAEARSAGELRTARIRSLFGEIRDGLATHGVDKDSLPRSLAHLMRTVADAFFTEAPQLLIEYWIRRSHSRSLRPSCIGGITGMPSTLVERSLVESATDLLAQNGDVPDLPAIEKASRRRTTSGTEPFWLTFLRQAFKAGKEKAIAEALRAYSPPDGDDFPIGRHLVEFSLLLLESEASSGKRWERETIEGCVLTVGRRLGTLFPTHDPAGKLSQELERIYWQAIEDSLRDSRNPRSMQRAVTWAIREFHRYLLTKGGPPVDESSLFRPLRGLIGVDARVCSLDDIYAMVEYLKHTKTSSEAVRAAAIAELIFGFGAGLRRMEGLGLRKIDWPNGTSSMILVREWEMRGLKTPNAFRWLPLALFIPEDLLMEAERWREFATVGEDGDHLFRVRESDSDPVRENEVIGLVTEAMCFQMKDDSYHYHLLRHSFCHWALMRLLLSDLENYEDDVDTWFPHLEKTRDWLKQSNDFRFGLYGNDSATNDHAWAVATLMGHCSPDVANTHYVHCMDIVGFLYLQRAFGGASDEDLLLALGLPERTRQMHRHDARETTTKFLERNFPTITIVEESEQVPCWIDQVHAVLEQRRSTHQPVDQIAPYFHMAALKAIQSERRSLEIFDSLQSVTVPAQTPSDGMFLPSKPFARYRHEVLELARKVEAAATKDDESEEIADKALRYFMRKTDGTSSALEFTDVESAKTYVRFLHNAKIGRDDLRFELRGADEGSVEALPFEKEFGRRLKFLRSRPGQTTASLTIEPIPPRKIRSDITNDPDPAESNCEPPTPEPELIEDEGEVIKSAVRKPNLYSRETFIFVMTMASIAFCPAEEA